MSNESWMVRQNVNGVGWDEAPVPPRWHRCRPQTVGGIEGTLVERCACGAIRVGDDRFWVDRNSRRRGRRCAG